MTPETHVYFRQTGQEPSAYVLVRLYEEEGQSAAEASLAGEMVGEAKYEYPTTGEPHSVLRDARDYAAGHGFDVRIELDGVAWDPGLGSLVG
ncbi:hypothetical protein Sa4125_20520 [Aureimonas sp. SA4125]|uniref:hypothetical protein n=1 Tax=Aureimonas sp. SA4125 TaxID=2826993 RepID=UPI001CC648D2|nr:hypothetical protein [Aureimonas sp. SA4125]BDA84510.1 hypothetical protein Sa4125_20520 [Aureimonas sp. SA4125]